MENNSATNNNNHQNTYQNMNHGRPFSEQQGQSRQDTQSFSQSQNQQPQQSVDEFENYLSYLIDTPSGSNSLHQVQGQGQSNYVQSRSGTSGQGAQPPTATNSNANTPNAYNILANDNNLLYDDITNTMFSPNSSNNVGSLNADYNQSMPSFKSRQSGSIITEQNIMDKFLRYDSPSSITQGVESPFNYDFNSSLNNTNGLMSNSKAISSDNGIMNMNLTGNIDVGLISGTGNSHYMNSASTKPNPNSLYFTDEELSFNPDTNSGSNKTPSNNINDIPHNELLSSTIPSFNSEPNLDETLKSPDIPYLPNLRGKGSTVSNNIRSNQNQYSDENNKYSSPQSNQQLNASTFNSPDIMDSLLKIPIPTQSTSEFSPSNQNQSSVPLPEIFVQHSTISKTPPPNFQFMTNDFSTVSNISNAATNNSSQVDLYSNSNSMVNMGNQYMNNNKNNNSNLLSTHNFQGNVFSQPRISSSTNLSDITSPYLSGDELDDNNSVYDINLNPDDNHHHNDNEISLTIGASIGALNLNNSMLTEKNLQHQQNKMIGNNFEAQNSANDRLHGNSNNISNLSVAGTNGASQMHSNYQSFNNIAHEAAANTPSLFSNSSKATTPVNGRSRSNSVNGDRPSINVEDISRNIEQDFDLNSSPFSPVFSPTNGQNSQQYRATGNQNFLSLPQDDHNNMRLGRQRRMSDSRSNSRSNSRSGSASRSHSNNSGYESDTRSDISAGSAYSRKSSSSKKQPALFECHICGKKLTRQYNLKSHLRTHSNEKPYTCDVCGKAFARQHDRNRHRNLHTGEKKYKCQGMTKSGVPWGCGKIFPRTDALRRHLQTESGRECIKQLVLETHRERVGFDSPENDISSPEDAAAAASVAVASAAATAKELEKGNAKSGSVDKEENNGDADADEDEDNDEDDEVHNNKDDSDSEPPPPPVTESRPDIQFTFDQ